MAIKKYTSGAWVPTNYRKYGTETDTITSLPAQIIGNGQPITSCQISGNTVQDGTPTPEAPVDVVGCGGKTGNVMPAGEQKIVEVNGITFSSDGNGKYTILGTATAYASARFNLLSAFTAPISVSNGGQGTLSFFNTQSNNDVTFIFYNDTKKADDWEQLPIRRTSTAYNTIGNKYVNNVVITVNSGATVDMTITPEFTNNGVLPSSFKPYGYKLPLTVNGTEYPIYLGEVQTTRKIKKLVLTGNETVYIENGMFDIRASDFNVPISSYFAAYCNFYIPGIDYSNVRNNNLVFAVTTSRILIHDNSFSNVTDFKSYLAAQYAAGTPVTVWYVLAEPETGIVNEPLMKIGDYADTVSATNIPTTGTPENFDVGTTLKPSEVQLTYHGWHEHADTKYTE